MTTEQRKGAECKWAADMHESGLAAIHAMYEWFYALDIDHELFRPRIMGIEERGNDVVYTFGIEGRPGTFMNPLPPED